MQAFENKAENIKAAKKVERASRRTEKECAT